MFVLCIFLMFAVLVTSKNQYYVDESSVLKTDQKWTMTLLYNKTEAYGKDTVIERANATFESLDRYVLHIKITDADKKRWEAPLINPKPPFSYKAISLIDMGLEVTNKSFGFTVTDPRSRKQIVELSEKKDGSFQFNDKYLEMGLWFDSQRFFGFGERTTSDFALCNSRKSCTYTIWGKDSHTPIDIGNGTSSQTYGQQPFYIFQANEAKLFFGVFILNSNAQDMEMNKTKDGGTLITHKMIGGVFDIYIFYPGPNATDSRKTEFMLSKYHELIGLPHVPPFWALGYHQSRFGWKSLTKMKDVLAKFEQNNLPLEVMWSDIDYMEAYTDFTIDPVNYRYLGDFVKTLHKKKIYWVPIIDAGLKYDKSNKHYQLGEKLNAFIKSAVTGKSLIAKVWPGPAVFLAWLNPNTTEVWHTGLQDLYNEAEFDGIWLDMNEVASFCPGECPPTESLATSCNYEDQHDPHEFDDLPYIPGKKNLTEMTISLTGYHPAITPEGDRLWKEYNTHGVWNLYQSKATHEFFTEKLKRRPFILTRSNFPGTGLYATKWLGDNHSTVNHLRASIVGIFNYQLFGIPFVGDDLCGFLDNTTENLCLRWMQLGAFYPFTRNHNVLGAIDQEPYALGNRVLVASRNAIRQKYSILRYYYTKLFEVSLYGGTLIRPVFFEFPSSSMERDMTKHFMIGPSLLVVPVLELGIKTIPTKFPSENWYDLRTQRKTINYTKYEQFIHLPASEEYVNVFIRGGSIIPYQNTLAAKIMRTETLNVLPMEIVVAPDRYGEATGSLIIDDGVSLDPIGNKAYRHLEFKFSQRSKLMQVSKTNTWSGPKYRFEEFSRLTILGIEEWKDVTNLCLIVGTKISEYIPATYNYEDKKITFYKPRSGIDWIDVTSITFNSTCE